MTHKMRLDPAPFAATKKGLKRIEIRLNDEKRKVLKKDDTIEFENTETGEKLTVQVKAVRKYKSMSALMSSEEFSKTGGIYQDPGHWAKSINSYYTKADQEKFGLLSIEIN
ncbi:ASCH domain protein [compost metagenome]